MKFRVPASELKIKPFQLDKQYQNCTSVEFSRISLHYSFIPSPSYPTPSIFSVLASPESCNLPVKSQQKIGNKYNVRLQIQLANINTQQHLFSLFGLTLSGNAFPFLKGAEWALSVISHKAYMQYLILKLFPNMNDSLSKEKLNQHAHFVSACSKTPSARGSSWCCRAVSQLSGSTLAAQSLLKSFADGR